MIELNHLYNEDCLDTMKRMDDNFVDLTVTSPPYDNLRNYKGYGFDFKTIAKELYRITKQGGVVVWVVGDAVINGSETGTSFKQVLYFRKTGFRIHDTMIFGKTNYIPLTHNRYEQAFEYMFILSKGKPSTINLIKERCITSGDYNLSRKGHEIKEGSMRCRNEVVTTNEMKIKPNIWYYTLGSLRCNHPTPFPEKLVADHILSWSGEGDLVYDPFMGSGTTGLVAYKLNRKFIGSEISKEYCEIAEKRLSITRQIQFT